MQYHENENLDDRQVTGGVPLQVLDHGFVRVEGTLGTEVDIVKAFTGLSTVKTTGAHLQRMVDYIISTDHLDAQIDVCHVTLHIRLPLMVATTLSRLITKPIVQHYPSPPVQYVQEAESIPVINGEGEDADAAEAMVVRDQFLKVTDSLNHISAQALSYALNHGVSVDSGQINLLQSHYVDWRTTLSVHDIMRLLKVLMHRNALPEASAYGQVLARILQAWLPMVYNSWLEYRFHSASFSVKEQGMLSHLIAQFVEGLLSNIGLDDAPKDFDIDEWRNFVAKLQSIAALSVDDDEVDNGN